MEATDLNGTITMELLGLDRTYREILHTTAILVTRTSNPMAHNKRNRTRTRTKADPIPSPKMKGKRGKDTWVATSMPTSLTKAKVEIQVVHNLRRRHSYFLYLRSFFITSLFVRCSIFLDVTYVISGHIVTIRLWYNVVNKSYVLTKMVLF